MGIAAYNRGSAAISAHIDADRRAVEFEIIEHLNSLEKYPDAGIPFGPINFVPYHSGWLAECPVTGSGFYYQNIREAVRRWQVTITGFDKGTFTAAVKNGRG